MEDEYCWGGFWLGALRMAKSLTIYVHSEDGEDVFVDLTISSKGAKSLRCLLLLLWERFGPRRRITFNRLGKPRSYDYMNFMRKAIL